jgi:mycothiol synthase
MSDFIVRHYVPEQDLSLLSRLLTEIESIDHDGEDTSEEYLHSMKEWPNFDPDQNVWVAELNGSLVGYGQIVPRPMSHSSIYVVVHPAHRGKGLGSQLLSLALSRAREAESKLILVSANSQNAASNVFLKQHGFEVAGTSGMLVAPVSDIPQAVLPPGFSLRRYPELGNPQIVVQALDTCYRGMVGHRQNVTSADRYINYHGEEGIHLLFNEQGTLIGVCAGKPQGKTDERGVSDLLDAPGFIQEYRHHGLQRFLTLAVMNWLREKGTRPITLEYWGDDETALDIYRDLGFELVNQQVTYRKEIQ